LSRAADSANPILLYDGVCGLCNRLVQFTLRHDVKRRLKFAALQSDFAAQILTRHALNPEDLDTVYLVEAYGLPGERLAERSDAVISVLRQIGGAWAAVAAFLWIIPGWLRDWGYRIIARNRYRIFGKSDTCLWSENQNRDRFLDV
jgi:predicted DCC family thiol-disulfide oxidoreductase YuxK